ncbi:unnamed protein product [Allacma fusca]|uniref:Peptidase M12B domain-containing protein n=2 Tax=Allacma fusca TaxID=39272 RepID=A0A8J2MGK9_9HEXA|nr:unnamed protein product [Allacma fusca]
MLGKTTLFAILCLSFEGIRSAPSSRHTAVVNFAPIGEAFHGEIHVNGEPFQLKLKPQESSVFTPEFRLAAAEIGPEGETIFRDVTPSDNMADWENNIYVDEDANAIFKMEHVDGEMRLQGIMDNIHIAHDGKDHIATIRDDPPLLDPTKTDYVSTGVSLEFDDDVDTRQAVSASPELFIFVDNKMWKDLNRSDSAIMTYLSVFIRGVNNRYRTVSDPSITYKIVKAIIIKDTKSQPFIENHRQSDGLVDIHEVLEEYSLYLYKNRNSSTFPKHDLAPLMSGENFGQTAGVAWLGGACQDGWNQAGDRISWRASVNRDTGASWQGIHTLAHELAHNMGSPHDGQDNPPDENTADCPWSDGYIMSYVFNLTNTLTFSSCSKSYMKKFIM